MGLWATNSNAGDIFGLHVSSLLLDKVGWYVILWVLAGAGMDPRGGNGNQSDPVLPHYLFLIICNMRLHEPNSLDYHATGTCLPGLLLEPFDIY